MCATCFGLFLGHSQARRYKNIFATENIKRYNKITPQISADKHRYNTTLNYIVVHDLKT